MKCRETTINCEERSLKIKQKLIFFSNLFPKSRNLNLTASNLAVNLLNRMVGKDS